jgi:hypothetical protein
VSIRITPPAVLMAGYADPLTVQGPLMSNGNSAAVLGAPDQWDAGRDAALALWRQ